MSPLCVAPARFIGLDIHQHYLVAVGVDAQQQVVFGPQRVAYTNLTPWIAQHLTLRDAVVLEMTTNAFQIHDELRRTCILRWSFIRNTLPLSPKSP